MAQQSKEFIPTRRSLLTRLKQWDDEQGWREFFETYWRFVYSVALKSGLTEGEAQEVVQETILSVAKQMRTFKYDPAVGSFKSWLLRLTRRRIADQFRKRPREQLLPQAPADESARTAVEAKIPDPASLDSSAVWEHEWQKNVLEAALERVKKRVSPRQYQIFDLYVLKEWPVPRIQRLLRVTRGQVYLAKVRVGGLVKKEAKRCETGTV